MRDAFGKPQRVAVIGGASDIGLAIAGALDPERLDLLGRDPSRLATEQPQAQVTHWDAADPATHATACDALFAGADVDVVVIAAGLLHTEPDADQISAMLQVNAAGSTAMLAHVAERMRIQGHGTIVVLSTITTARPRPSNFWYGASKTSLDFAARGLLRPLAAHGIDVLIVRPGFVRSKMTQALPEAPFTVEPQVVGSAVADAVRDRRTGIVWVPGVLKLVAALLSVLPQSLIEKLDRA